MPEVTQREIPMKWCETHDWPAKWCGTRTVSGQPIKPVGALCEIVDVTLVLEPKRAD